MEIQGLNYKKRIQKGLNLKLKIVKEIDQGLLTPTRALNKYGVQATSTLRSWLKKNTNKVLLLPVIYLELIGRFIIVR